MEGAPRALSTWGGEGWGASRAVNTWVWAGWGVATVWLRVPTLSKPEEVKCD